MPLKQYFARSPILALGMVLASMAMQTIAEPFICPGDIASHQHERLTRDTTGDTALLDTAAQQGRIRLIIRLQTAHAPTLGTYLDDSAMESLRLQQIACLQRALLGNLGLVMPPETNSTPQLPDTLPEGFHSLRLYQSIPMLAMEVDPSILARLLAHPAVAAIQQDVPDAPFAPAMPPLPRPDTQEAGAELRPESPVNGAGAVHIAGLLGLLAILSLRGLPSRISRRHAIPRRPSSGTQ